VAGACLIFFTQTFPVTLPIFTIFENTGFFDKKRVKSHVSTLKKMICCYRQWGCYTPAEKRLYEI